MSGLSFQDLHTVKGDYEKSQLKGVQRGLRTRKTSTCVAWEQGRVLTVMDLIAVLLQALDVALFQHTMSHQQLQKSPVDIGHDARSPRAALHGWRN